MGKEGKRIAPIHTTDRLHIYGNVQEMLLSPQRKWLKKLVQWCVTQERHVLRSPTNAALIASTA